MMSSTNDAWPWFKFLERPKLTIEEKANKYLAPISEGQGLAVHKELGTKSTYLITSFDGITYWCWTALGCKFEVIKLQTEPEENEPERSCPRCGHTVFQGKHGTEEIRCKKCHLTGLLKIDEDGVLHFEPYEGQEP